MNPSNPLGNSKHSDVIITFQYNSASVKV
jgi:hypothetical protein